ncbi:MAG TPA: efflux RND transporter periplasmic adaptor subunit [Gemmataceae bacterium]|nr:efflux RND transporter periplasmic adaptor subunit [Gemmataceae bacterium]
MVRIARMPLVGLGVFLGCCLAFTGCSGAPEQEGRSPPTVYVSYPLQDEVTDYQDYTGRTAAVDSVQVQARVTGYLENIYFREGAEVRGDDRVGPAARVVGLLGGPAGPLLAAADLFHGTVQAGDLLYEIDPRPYQATYDAAKAQVAQNVASLELARQDNRRYKALARDKEGAVTQVDLDKYQSQEDQAVANLDQARANLRTAELNLEWTKVTAPVSGLVGRLLVTRGNLIVANQTTLTTVVRQDPMWVYFDADEPTVLQVHELMRQGKFGPASAGPPKIPFHLQLANEKGFPHEAILDFVNNQIDQPTATLLIRAIFPNPKPANGPRLFAPNNFVRVRVPTSAPYQALLVNPEAVGTDQALKYVYVVDDGNKVVRRAVKLGPLHDGLQVITEGSELKKEERVIVEGLQRVQQDATVNPTLKDMPRPPPGPLSPTPPPVLKAPAPPPTK